MMWREMTDRLIESDSELSAWRTALTVRYIVNSWNDAHDTPISEDAVLLFLCDETKGDLTEEQRGLRKNAQGGDPERHPQDDMRVAVVRQHGPAGMRGRLPAVSQTASAAPGERFPGPAILPPVRPCGPLCGPMTGGAGPLPLPAVRAGVGRLWEALRHKASGPF